MEASTEEKLKSDFSQGSADILEADEANPKELIETGEATKDIYVHVCGAVKSPGVYVLSADSRAYEAIEAAGGFEECADEGNLNLATKLTDGEKLYVYSEGELEAASGEAGSNAAKEIDDGKVNINQASVKELMTLPRIGESKANKIVTYREENGGFSAPEDIMKVSGIGEGIYAEIKEYIKL
ncbi:MAG: helix-hairpin-helix domain-containing protein [Pseudobutyrivibrio sp.]|nr:helix-hairpin-helix domain-containing protein [Pseudobutyrivibrio sp.]